MNAGILLALFVLGADRDRSLDFDTEVLPVLTRAGCNAGACHGAAAGRGGFQLSLLGSDPAADYEAIAQAFEGRRIDHADPEFSLLLRKPTGQLEHGGGEVLESNGAGATRIVQWIRQGARRATRRRLVAFDVQPRQAVLDAPGAQVALRAIARFDDGSTEDVTAWTLFTPSDPSAVAIDEARARVARRGVQVVIARYLDRVLPLQWLVPLNDNVLTGSSEPRRNFIDDEILATLAVLRIPPSPSADDATFARRTSLDLTGRLADPELVQLFVADAAVDKRDRWVDRLLASSAFVDFWTLRWARLLDLHRLPNEPEAVAAYARWLRHQVSVGEPLDQMGRELLLATGDSHQIGPANFARMVPDARAHAELVGRFFLGAQLGCANCHNHPLDRWTQDDYHGLGAIFARVERGRHVSLAARGAVMNPRTGQPATPRIPGVRNLTGDGDHRLELAHWLVDAENRVLPRTMVNRLWRALFGRGLVEPADDLRETNPPTHPELLDRLTDDYVRYGLDLRHMLRRMVQSEAYARAGTARPDNAADDRFYARSYARPLSPEVLADAIADVTDVPPELPAQPVGTRAVQLVDPMAPAPVLDILGRCSRGGGCGNDAGSRPGLATQLHLMNGELLNERVTHPQGRLQRLIRDGQSNDQIVAEFYWRALGRSPSADEQQMWTRLLDTDSAEERTKRLEDFLWSLLNSRAFREVQ